MTLVAAKKIPTGARKQGHAACDSRHKSRLPSARAQAIGQTRKAEMRAGEDGDPNPKKGS